MIGDSQLWRGDLWRLQQIMDNLQIHLPRGYHHLEFVNLSGALRITTDDPDGVSYRCTIQKGEFVWVRDGRLESGDIDDYAEAKREDRKKWYT